MGSQGVIPVKTGIQKPFKSLDSGSKDYRNDKQGNRQNKLDVTLGSFLNFYLYHIFSTPIPVFLCLELCRKKLR